MLSFTNLLVALIFLGLSVPVSAQNQSGKNHNPKEVSGSGRLLQEQITLKSFDALEIEYVYGNIAVELGGTTSALDIQLDDNLRPLLRVEEEGGTLKLSFRDSQGNAIWTIDASVTVTIKTPSLKALVYGANGTLTVNGLKGDAFSLTNKANGQITLGGKVSSLKVVNQANGSVQAEELVARQAYVVTQANGSVRVNAEELQTVTPGYSNIFNVAQKP